MGGRGAATRRNRHKIKQLIEKLQASRHAGMGRAISLSG
jgi:hypothetical protein